MEIRAEVIAGDGTTYFVNLSGDNGEVFDVLGPYAGAFATTLSARINNYNAVVAERDKLREFVDHALRNYSWDCADTPDGGDLQDKAEELGLIEERPISQEDSIDGETEHYFTIWTPRAAVDAARRKG
jgi:hypothetical protein